jgi:hypothetical protein
MPLLCTPFCVVIDFFGEQLFLGFFKYMTDDREELERIAYHLWVLAHRPQGGPEQFQAEAARLLARKRPSGTGPPLTEGKGKTHGP